ncbi:MAG: aspartate aminotransferase family protein [Candidatus Abyssobacteria bacterium SURF_5]|uniref:Aspartate aminotransferase family protein n=1 Tax=Abyssobacteria bacterium (strain SURF_5) TaxID=2093360 RepID=A0A3A4N0T7_ABYX5|nr:MAG: aspartate aminotransferase family protein [Candidatus Abyssubacteria bacterium SURF_5]
MTKETNWDQIYEWDSKYYFHVKQAADEYRFIPVDHTEGNYVVLANGMKLLDFCSQVIAANLGYKNEYVNAAIKEALDKVGFVQELFCTEYRARAAKLIMEDLLGPDNWAGRIRFVNTGSEANEQAFAIAKNLTGRPNIITREYAYHGSSSGAAGASRNRYYRASLASPTSGQIRDVPNFPGTGFHIVPAPYCYRCSVGHTYPSCKQADGTLACIKASENLIKTVGAETVAAVVTEIFYGGSAINPPPEYIPQLREMTRRLGILWIDDEVICGFGRCGKWFAYQLYEGVTPDIMTIGKGMNGCAVPVGGVVLSKDITKEMDKYRYWSGSTHAGHPLAAASVAAAVEYQIKQNMPAVVAEKGAYLHKKLKELEGEHKCIGLAESVGLLGGFEVVKNKQTKEPFVKEDRFATFTGDISKYPEVMISEKCVFNGVMVGSAVPNTIRVAPPFTITSDEIDFGIDVLNKVLSEIDEMCD